MAAMTEISPASLPSDARQRGFTLVEVAVSMIVTVIVLLGVLALFDFSNKLTHVQTNISDMQQSLRVAQADAVRLIRMAGRGGLTLGTLPTGFAVAVRNNVPDNSHIGGGATPEIVPGSDVLTIRGTFSTPLYQLQTGGGGSMTLLPAGAPTGGKLQVSNLSPTYIPQDVAPLVEAVTKRRKEALILVSFTDPSVWAVVELDPDNSNVGTPTNLTIAFKITGGTNTAAYSQLSSAGPGVFPAALKNPASVGLLEEYRFYVRRAYAITGDKKSDLTPKLSRARAYPNTDNVWGDDAANWQADIADNIFDLQVALGLDTPANDPATPACTTGQIASDDLNCGIYESADGENDDWMYNGEKNTNPLLFANSDLHYIRLTTLARTDRRDKDYQAPTLVRVEDNKYDTSPFNTDTERMYRRRILRTMIDMRNLG